MVEGDEHNQDDAEQRSDNEPVRTDLIPQVNQSLEHGGTNSAPGDENTNWPLDERGLIKEKPLEVFLRYEEDVAAAYREYYRDHIANDKRTELGRFLFGVSSTTIGLFVSLLALSNSSSLTSLRSEVGLLISGLFLLLSAVCSLRLAVPKTQNVDPTALELVKLHHSNSVELSRLAFIWFALWFVGLVAGAADIIG